MWYSIINEVRTKFIVSNGLVTVYNVRMTRNTKSRVGTLWGIPYDWRSPTKERFKSRVWNSKAPFINPRWWGWGYDINFYAIIHPTKWRTARKTIKR